MSKYDDWETCPVCGGINQILTSEKIEWTLVEAATRCERCGHEDYWSLGFYESGEWVRT